MQSRALRSEIKRLWIAVQGKGDVQQKVNRQVYAGRQFPAITEILHRTAIQTIVRSRDADRYPASGTLKICGRDSFPSRFICPGHTHNRFAE